MGFKTITIKKSVYQKLLAMKNKDESFSELFERLSEKNIGILKKMRGTIEFDNKKMMIKEIYSKRQERRYG